MDLIVFAILVALAAELIGKAVRGAGWLLIRTLFWSWRSLVFVYKAFIEIVSFISWRVRKWSRLLIQRLKLHYL